MSGATTPPKKVPGDCDVPLERYVGGAAYLRALEETLPPVFAQTEPDLVFWISGADNHTDDRFGQMALTEADMAARDRFVLDLCQNLRRALRGSLRRRLQPYTWENRRPPRPNHSSRRRPQRVSLIDVGRRVFRSKLF